MLDKSPHQVRQIIRSGGYSGQTAGLCMGYLQANLVVLPKRYALEFFQYCQRNVQPCPIIAVGDSGRRDIYSGWSKDVDIASDLPRYHVYSNGVLKDTPTDIAFYWSADLVTFLLGCSFTFENALLADNISLRHLAENKTVAMYRTSIKTRAAGDFAGGMVVSMRPIRCADVARVCAITSRFSHAHGEPVHIGEPHAIGISSLEHPDWGDPVAIMDDEIPVFWACGVTPQVALETAKPSFCITHAPGHMLITDIPDRQQYH